MNEILTKRELYAAMAMQSLLIGEDNYEDEHNEYVCDRAFLIADQMILSGETK
jgi:hypothetical protein